MNTKTSIITRLTVALAATVLAAGVTAFIAVGQADGPPQPPPQDTGPCRLLSGWERSNC